MMLTVEYEHILKLSDRRDAVEKYSNGILRHDRRGHHFSLSPEHVRIRTRHQTAESSENKAGVEGYKSAYYGRSFPFHVIFGEYCIES